MFESREEAGRTLAKILHGKNFKDAVIISIPRGGVVVAAAVSKILKLPHSAILVKKIGAPDNPELAVGATGSNKIVYWDYNLIKNLRISEAEQLILFENTVKIVREKEKSLGLKLPDVRDKTVILVDDGVATGATVIAASLILKDLGAREVILATPVISVGTKRELKPYFSQIITAELPQDFRALSQFYKDFQQVTDEEVKKLLRK